MHILHTESSPSLGGQELRILYEMKALSAHGYHSSLIAREHSPIVAEAKAQQLVAYGIKIRSSIDPAAIAFFYAYMKKHHVDLVNAHNSKDGWNAAIAAKLLGIPLIRARHIANPIRTGYFSQLIYGSLSAAVMTTSDSIRQHMIEKGIDGNKIISIPTGVDIEKFSQGVSGKFRASLNIPTNVPLVAQIAVLRGSKGPHFFLEAAQRLIASGCPAYFVLIGEGPSRPRLEAMLQEHPSKQIILAGYRQDIPDILADIDLSVLSAAQPEGVPQAVLQAFAAKKHVIASDLGGINEVAIHNKTATLVPAKDPEQLSQAIAHALHDMTHTTRLVDNAFSLASTQYSRDCMLKKLSLVYQQVVSHKKIWPHDKRPDIFKPSF